MGLAPGAHAVAVNMPAVHGSVAESEDTQSEDERSTAKGQPRQKSSRFKNITREQLRQCFHLPREEACAVLQVSTNCLKRVCRKHGISRWPHRKLQFLDNLAHSCSSYSTDRSPEEIQELLVLIAEEKASVMADPNHMVNEQLLHARMATYKARYRAKGKANEGRKGGGKGGAARAARGGASSRAWREADEGYEQDPYQQGQYAGYDQQGGGAGDGSEEGQQQGQGQGQGQGHAGSPAQRKRGYDHGYAGAHMDGSAMGGPYAAAGPGPWVPGMQRVPYHYEQALPAGKQLRVDPLMLGPPAQRGGAVVQQQPGPGEAAGGGPGPSAHPPEDGHGKVSEDWVAAQALMALLDVPQESKPPVMPPLAGPPGGQPSSSDAAPEDTKPIPLHMRPIQSAGVGGSIATPPGVGVGPLLLPPWAGLLLQGGLGALPPGLTASALAGLAGTALHGLPSLANNAPAIAAPSQQAQGGPAEQAAVTGQAAAAGSKGGPDPEHAPLQQLPPNLVFLDLS